MAIVDPFIFFLSAELSTLLGGQEESAVGCEHCDLCGDHAVGVVALDAVRQSIQPAKACRRSPQRARHHQLDDPARRDSRCHRTKRRWEGDLDTAKLTKEIPRLWRGGSKRLTFPAVAPQAPIDETLSVSRQAHKQSSIDGRPWALGKA
jgi:hypothetical protein